MTTRKAEMHFEQMCSDDQDELVIRYCKERGMTEEETAEYAAGQTPEQNRYLFHMVCELYSYRTLR